MNFSNIKQNFQKNFQNNYKILSARINNAYDPEEKTRIYIGICTLIFFIIGLFYDTISYLLAGIYLLLAVNIITLSIFTASAIVFQREKLSVYSTLTLLLLTVQINVSISIIYNYINAVEGNEFVIYHDLFVGFLVCILGALTLEKKRVHILCIMPMASFATSLAIHSPISLIQYFPSLLLAYASPPIFLTQIRMILWKTLREKEQLLHEKQSLCRFMGMNEQQWELVIDVIQAPRAPRKQTEQLFSMIQESISNQLILRAKRLLASEEVLEKINEKKCFCLTRNEVQLCGLILEDKSIVEISKLLYINKSTVRANRSRIRKKLKLAHNINLKSYLGQLIAEANREDLNEKINPNSN